MDYFEYFGINPAYYLDLNELRKKYYEKSKSIHPDYQNVNKDDSIYLSAYNNQAYQHLTEPLSRLKYIIELFTGPLQDDHHLLGQDFLMDMLELHETLHEAVLQKDEQALQAGNETLKKLQEEAQLIAEKDLKAFDQGIRSENMFENLTRLYFKLKYFKRLNQTLENSNPEI